MHTGITTAHSYRKLLILLNSGAFVRDDAFPFRICFIIFSPSLTFDTFIQFV